MTTNRSLLFVEGKCTDDYPNLKAKDDWVEDQVI
jgi:hypothetical protein